MKTITLKFTVQDLRDLEKICAYGALMSRGTWLKKCDKFAKQFHRAHVGKIHGIDPDKKHI